MEDLLTLVGDDLTLNPHFLSIEVIARIWKRDPGQSQTDKGLGKNVRIRHVARRELSWIWFMESWKSPFQTYTNPNNRAVKIKEKIGLAEDWKEDKALQEAREYYRQMQEELNTKLANLRSARNAMGAIREFLDTVNLLIGNNTPSGAAIYKPADIAKAIKEMNIAEKSVEEIELAVRKAQTVEKKVRGGGNAGRYED